MDPCHDHISETAVEYDPSCTLCTGEPYQEPWIEVNGVLVKRPLSETERERLTEGTWRATADEAPE